MNRLKPAFVYETVKNYTVHYDQSQIYAKIHHEVNQFCSSQSLHEIYIDRFDQLDDLLQDALQASCEKWAPGIEIIAVRVTKPSIPTSVRLAFEQMVSEETNVQLVAEKQKSVVLDANSKKKASVSEAEKKLSVAKIEAEKLLAVAQAKVLLAEIDNQMLINRTRSKADAELFGARKQAEAEQLLLTSEFLKLQQLRAFVLNSTFFIGNVPQQLMVWGKPEPSFGI